MNDETYPILCFGEVLWDLLPSGKLPGGAPMNVAFQCKQLGLQSAIISRIGNDPLGQELQAFLNEKEINTQYLQIDTQQATGKVKVTLDAGGSPSYEIVQPVAWDFIELDEALLPLVRQSRAFVFGSLASRNDSSRKTLGELLELAPWKVFDVNLREPFYSQNLIENLLQKAQLVKMNDEELNLIAAWSTNLQGQEEQMRYLQDRFGFQTICLTRGASGAALLDEQGLFFEQSGFPVVVEDTIGSGDAFLAGLVTQKLTGAAWPQALAYACATGAYVASRKGGTPSFSKTVIDEMVKQG